MGDTETTASDDQLIATLDEIVRLVRESGVGSIPDTEVERARRQALRLQRADPGAAEAIVRLRFATQLLAAIAVDLAADPAATIQLAEQIEAVAAVPALALGAELLREPHGIRLYGTVALEVDLRLLLVFGRAAAASLWTLSRQGEPELLAKAGTEQWLLEASEQARELLGGSGARMARRPASAGAAVIVPGAASAALVVQADGRLPAESELLLELAGPAVAATLDRLQLTSGAPVADDSVIGSLDRRIDRLRFDLHDGPQQDVHLLAMDLRLFREQVRPLIAGHRHAERLLGRLDDLEAQLNALDGDLRRIATSMQSPFLPAGSVSDAVHEIAAAFASRTAIHPEVQIHGDLAGLTESQQITVLALVREALSNVQKHSDATRVTITLAAHARGLDVEVSDDGRGFDPEQTLVAAAREGHLGVVGIHERVRMLGGNARIESRPGGPTVISAALPRWPRP